MHGLWPIANGRVQAVDGGLAGFQCVGAEEKRKAGAIYGKGEKQTFANVRTVSWPGDAR